MEKKPENENDDNTEAQPKTEAEKRRAVYDAASALAETTHQESMKAFAIAVRDFVEKPDELAARQAAEVKHAAALKKQTR